MSVLVHMGHRWCPLTLGSTHFSVYFFTPLDNFICPLFKFPGSSAYPSLLLNPSSEFFNSVTTVVQLQNISFWFFL